MLSTLHLSLSMGLRLLLAALLATLALRIALTYAGVWARLEALTARLTARLVATVVARAPSALSVGAVTLLVYVLRLLRLLPRGLRWQVADQLSLMTAMTARTLARALARGKRAYAALVGVLERFAFPPFIAYAINPVVIVADLLLIPLLIVFRNEVVLVLVINSYLNAFSVAVGSMVAHLQKRAENQQAAHVAVTQSLHERHDAHASELAALREVVNRVERLLTIGPAEPEDPAS